MTKLKTLKDMKTPKFKEEFIDRSKLVSRVELRREAVKWIKEWENGIGGQPAIEFIKHFFNITEEDLNERD
jgi:hypothetical protein